MIRPKGMLINIWHNIFALLVIREDACIGTLSCLGFDFIFSKRNVLVFRTA